MVVVSKMGIVIRKMVEEDLTRVMEIERNSFSDPWSMRSFRREIRENPYALYLSACFDDQLAGYVGGWLITDELHITNLAVDPSYRRLHIAEKLIDELLKISKRKGIMRATLEVRKSNMPAIRLYTKKGFQPAGIRPRYYRDNMEDALIMWKEFSQKEEKQIDG